MTGWRVRWSLGFLAAGLALATAAWAQNYGDNDSKKPPSCVTIVFASEQEHGGDVANVFSGSRTVDVTLGVLFPLDFGGKHKVEARLFTPRGFLYQSLAVPVAQPGDSEQNRNLVGYPNPLKTQEPKKFKYRGTEYWKVDVRFPVGGTLITSNSLYGNWTVQAFVDGSPSACSAPVPFAITQ